MQRRKTKKRLDTYRNILDSFLPSKRIANHVHLPREQPSVRRALELELVPPIITLHARLGVRDIGDPDRRHNDAVGFVVC